MKKMISAIIAVFIIPAQLTVNAAVINAPQETDNNDGLTTTLTISGQIPIDAKIPSGHEVMVRVYQRSTTNNLQIEHMEQTTANENGDYSIAYVKGSDSGDYRIEVNYAAAEAGSVPEYITHNYLSPALFTEFFEALDDIYVKKDEVGYDGPAELYKKLVYYMGQNIISIPKMQEMIDNSENVTDVTAYMLNYSHEKSIDKLVKLFNEGYVISKINQADSGELEKVLTDSFVAPIIGLNAEIIETYQTLNKESVMDKMSALTFGQIGEINTRFTDIVLVEALSGKIWQTMLDILRENNSAIGIDFTAYDKLDKDKQEDAMKKFANNISSVKGAETAKSVFDTAVKNAHSAGNSGGSPSGGGNYDRVNIGGKDITPNYTINVNPSNVVQNMNNKQDEYFTDLDGYEWAKESIESLASQGYVSGDGNGKFRPGDKVTRAEFLKMVLEATRMKDAPESDKTFSDVNSASWYYRYVMQGVGAGIINGVSDKEFAPNDVIKRADAAVISIRILKYFGQEFTQKNIVYSDVREDYAFEAVYQASEAGIMNGVGDNLFEPDRALTRAEAAKIVYNINKCKGDYVG